MLMRMYAELWEDCHNVYKMYKDYWFIYDIEEYIYPLPELFYSYTARINPEVCDVNLFFVNNENYIEYNYFEMIDWLKVRLPRVDELKVSHQWYCDKHPHFTDEPDISLKDCESWNHFCLWTENKGLDTMEELIGAFREEGLL